MEKVGRRCRVLEGADSNLVDLCVRWDSKVSRAEGAGDLYRRDEAAALEAVVGQHEATFRIGLASARLARVSKDGRVVYHFDSERAIPVINVVKHLMEAIGYSCTSPLDGTLECNPPRQGYLDDKEVVDRLADIMSWTTSADLRLMNGFADECADRCGGKENVDCLVKCLVDVVLTEFHQYKNPKPDYKPHPVAVRDLKRFGIRWYR